MFYVSVFISHSWSYSEHYNKLREWIFLTPWKHRETPIEFRDVSIPKDIPIHNASSAAALRQAIFGRIQQAHVVVIPTGMYANYSNWIQAEIDGAQNFVKPILAVNLWGSERKSSVVLTASAKTVGWTADGVVSGVWDLGPYG